MAKPRQSYQGEGRSQIKALDPQAKRAKVEAQILAAKERYDRLAAIPQKKRTSTEQAQLGSVSARLVNLEHELRSLKHITG